MNSQAISLPDMDADSRDYLVSFIESNTDPEETAGFVRDFLSGLEVDSDQIEKSLASLDILHSQESFKPKKLEIDFREAVNTIEPISKSDVSGCLADRSRIMESFKANDVKSEFIPSKIVATSQQSRFHTETVTTLSNDIDLKSVNISINDLVLLQDARLTLFYGVHYGLVGQNGSGKSTLLKSMGERLLVGLPDNIRVFYVKQLVDIDTSAIVLDLVVGSNKLLNDSLRQHEALQNAFETGNAECIYNVYHSIIIERLECKLDKAEKIATLRSGARGHVARQDLLSVEKELEEARAFLNCRDSAQFEASIGAAHEMMDGFVELLDALDSESRLQRAEKILTGLGFTEEMKHGAFEYLSGGWRLKTALATALFNDPDVLLLDEPTNALDISAILWLQGILLLNKTISILCRAPY